MSKEWVIGYCGKYHRMSPNFKETHDIIQVYALTSSYDDSEVDVFY